MMDTNIERALAVAFYVPLVVAMVLETIAPRRAAIRSTAWRWLNTAGLAVINTMLARAAAFLTTLVAIVEIDRAGWGLLNQIALPGPVAFGVGILLLDFASYLKHRAFHAWPVLWQMHSVHHSDTDMDVATSLRHHPADYLLDTLMTVGIVLVLGLTVETVFAYQLLALVLNSFRHGNIRLPDKLERRVRLVLVTPDLHRVHHSSVERETNSNFGVLCPWWDRMLGTYVAQPAHGHEAMDLGLEYFRAPAENTIFRMLTQPLRQMKARKVALDSSGKQGQEQGPVVRLDA